MKDTGEGLYDWWKRDKISGTIMPIFLVLNVGILWLERDWTKSQLLANAFMLILMIWSIWQFRVRATAENIHIREVKSKETIELERIEKEYEFKHKQLELERERFEHKRDIENFAKSTVEAEQGRKMALIQEQADFVDDQIMSKQMHIIFLTQNFDMTNESMKKLVDNHIKDIDKLRVYKKGLPDKINLRLKEIYDLSPPTIRTSGEMVNQELQAVLGQIKNNTNLNQTIKDIESASDGIPQSVAKTNQS